MVDIATFQNQNREVLSQLPLNTIHQSDWRLLMAAIPDRSIDLVLTDPPYWTLDKWRSVGTTTRLGGHRDIDQRREAMWFPTIQKEDLFDLLDETWRVLKEDRHAYVMCDNEALLPLLEHARHDMMWRHVKPLVWDKVAPGMGYHYRAQYEFVVMLEKGKRRLNSLSIPDVLRYNRVAGGFPTEKPLELFKLLVSQSTAVGEMVVDPFCGSGTTAVASRLLGRTFIVGDIQETAIAETKRRLVEDNNAIHQTDPSSPA